MKSHYISHRLLDLLCVILAGAVAHYIRFDSIIMGEIYLFPLLFFALFVYVCLTSVGVYENALDTALDELWIKTIQSVLLAAILAMTFLYLTKTAELYSRIWFVLMVVITLVLAIGYRFALRRLDRTAVTTKNIILLGGNATAEGIVHSAKTAGSRIKVCGVFNLNEGAPETTGSGVLEDSIKLIESLRDLGGKKTIVSEVWVTHDIYSRIPELEIFEHFANTAVSLVFVPELPTSVHGKVQIEYVQGIPTIGSDLAYQQRRKHIIKLLEDKVIAWPLLIVSLPLFLVIAAAIKLDSKGPVFFGQKRYGAAGKEFRMWKFRTMTFASGAAEFKQAQENDPRVTRVGKWLRRFSIDELPQLINVVLGDMSLVGPRPHASEHNEEQRRVINGYMLRHRMKPGITGLAQVSGFRGATPSLKEMGMRTLLDLEYIRSWSLMLDFRILAKTVLVVLSTKNAY
ncbi:MAG: undecaprenyl-phosphate glucose phosphotransferase [Gammaproteobacteria bacterium]|nr:undecaprenyl-phosphate glucose phosphotransferase [Gammaproteobacteria bacterium]